MMMMIDNDVDVEVDLTLMCMMMMMMMMMMMCVVAGFTVGGNGLVSVSANIVNTYRFSLGSVSAGIVWSCHEK